MRPKVAENFADRLGGSKNPESGGEWGGTFIVLYSDVNDWGDVCPRPLPEVMVISSGPATMPRLS